MGSPHVSSFPSDPCSLRSLTGRGQVDTALLAMGIRLSIGVKVEAWIFFDLMQAPSTLRVIETVTIEDERVAKAEYMEPEAPPSLEAISQYPKEPQS